MWVQPAKRWLFRASMPVPQIGAVASFVPFLRPGNPPATATPGLGGLRPIRLNVWELELIDPSTTLPDCQRSGAQRTIWHYAPSARRRAQADEEKTDRL